MKLPKINIKELERVKEENFQERLKYIDMHVDWMKKTSNITWSSAQKSIINRRSPSDNTNTN